MVQSKAWWLNGRAFDSSIIQYVMEPSKGCVFKSRPGHFWVILGLPTTVFVKIRSFWAFLGLPTTVFAKNGSCFWLTYIQSKVLLA